MRIYTFLSAYPSPYKPYCDSQFGDLLRKGHDLRIFAHRSFDGVLNGKVARHGLRARTRYYYRDELRSLPGFTPAIVAAIARRPWQRGVTALRITRAGGSLKRRIKEAARVLTLPDAPPDLCLVHGLRTMVFLSWLRDLYPGVPIALYYHGGEPKEAGTLDPALARKAFDGADIVFTNTEFSRQEAVRRGCDAARTALLPVGFSLEDYRPPESRSYRAGGVLRLVSVGRLSEGKGHPFALEAISRLVRSGARELRYTIIGDGPLRPDLERAVDERELRRHVTFRGALPNQEVIAALATADALVLPSVATESWAETQAAVVQEALLMKALVITSRTGGVPESTPAAMQPFSAAPGDPASLAGAIGRVCRLSESGLRSLAEEGRRWAAENYDVSRLNDRMLREIRERAG